MMRLRVYVAGPYTWPSARENVDKAIEAGHRLLDAGYAPLVPHLSHFLHLSRPHHYEEWMAMDLAWVAAAQAIWRLPGQSKGADREVELARSLAIPVVYSLDELLLKLPPQA